MKTNEEGLHIIKHFEGFRSHSYLCPAGVWTQGYGSTRNLKGKRFTGNEDPITEDQAEHLLMQDCQRAEQAIDRLVRVPLSENEFSALVSFIYNCGRGAFPRSTMRMKINREEMGDAALEFPKWCRAGGRKLRGLILRREMERQLFVS